MALAILTNDLPEFFEGVAIPSVTFTASGLEPGSTLVWSNDPRNEQNVLVPLPPGLTLGSNGILSGTPSDIAVPGPGLISGTQGTYTLVINSVVNPNLYAGNQLVVGSFRYPVAAVTNVGDFYTVQTSLAVETGGYTDVAYSIVPIGGASSFPVIIRASQITSGQITAFVTRSYTITILKLNSTETLYRYFNEATDFDGRLLESTYRTIVSTLGTEERASVVSLVAGSDAQFNPLTGNFEKYVILPTFSTNNLGSLAES